MVPEWPRRRPLGAPRRFWGHLGTRIKPEHAQRAILGFLVGFLSRPWGCQGTLANR